jgi:Xaa-Pro aminopeptidase
MNPFRRRLGLIRRSMKKNKTDVYIIPSTDPHLGEYVPDHWRIIQWLTGFTGSAATVVITGSHAGLWTDSRYFIQAEQQLEGTGVTLMNTNLTDSKDFSEWLRETLKKGGRIGLDGRIFSISGFRKLETALKGRGTIIKTDKDLVSELWDNRPELPESKAFDHDISYCGRTREDKIIQVKERMKSHGADYHLVTSPDDIMWLLNIRGSDVRYSPLLNSYAIIGEEQILFFVDENRIPLKLASEFDRLNIVMLPYEEIGMMLKTLPAESSVMLNPSVTSVMLYKSLPKRVRIIEDISIPARLKSIKNKTEIANINRVMLKDGVALTKFFFWLETNQSGSSITEFDLADKVEEFRSLQKNYLGPSFRTIAAFNENGALPHYSATKDTASVIGSKGILLIDSGGQYLDGTTDITRTIIIGRASSQQKKDFTLVLKGMISLASAKFPAKTKGIQLDMLARKALWEQGLDYGHGTGHGVGFCLNVHEGPQSISQAINPGTKTVIEPGMLISNEPAIYREGEYGIRTENLILCYEDEETEFGKFLRFDTVSLCYIDKKLIDRSLLDTSEIDWLNDYHNEVYNKIGPSLSPDEQEWLKEKTSTL